MANLGEYDPVRDAIWNGQRWVSRPEAQSVAPTRDRIHAAYTAPMTAEDRLRLVTYLTDVPTVAVNQSDICDLLSTLDALRVSYAERGDVIAGLVKGER